ncbi:MAG TPA: lytic transglycosylase domain-containing protein [Flavobacteriales bacterium]|jgi:membrane-bound lytic murein transglycosylase D|nr:lytic transglycosylase domain-containing protein [Flavobacteriales bacterium]MBK6550919.1 lytic transglycosylase domain-containing protein [Flavobacteriales bacterium]MBK7101313.1 lytic transglycosylase domain-containing protein [Flavobacteriales bacterium]MBK7112019.1 lytic transglycosylase domain-containing protein [Flavobacteriales bacterium]MBK7481983.1 lytic transglycosylase domain-containing protein [Flavobacteriales bacterium]
MTPLPNTLRILLRTSLWALLLLGGSIALHLFTYSSFVVDNDLDHQRDFNDGYKVFSLTLPNELLFCGKKVPLERLDVRERLDRELLVNTYWQSNTLLAHKRASRWFPLIERILKEEGVPDDMKYIAVIESGLMNVISPAGATGYWQFMKETALGHGLEVNAEVDERYHVEKSTYAACKYLKNAYGKYNDWALAAASYNLGQGGVDKQLGRQKRDSYFDLLLNDETARYVYRILAMKEILRDPERYGFHLRKKDLYAPYRTRVVEVNGAVTDLADYAIAQGTDYKTLKLLNPWLRENRLTNREGRTYAVLLPAADFDTVEPH